MLTLQARDRDCSPKLSSVCNFKLAELGRTELINSPESQDQATQDQTRVGVDRRGRVWAWGPPSSRSRSFHVWATDCSGQSSREPALIQVDPERRHQVWELRGESAECKNSISFARRAKLMKVRIRTWVESARRFDIQIS